MARPVEWTQRLAQINMALEGIPIEQLDRRCVESIFGVSASQALRIMRQVGGYKYGKSFVVDRRKLIQWANRKGEDPDVGRERHRFVKVTDSLEKIRDDWEARRHTFRVEKAAEYRGMDELPEGVKLGKGSLLIEFANAEDLMQKLYALGKAMAHDFETFEKICRG
jgi:hypothetical protein